LQSSDFVRRFLHHPDFRTKRLRMGKVVRVSSHRVTYWEINNNDEEIVDWQD